MVLMVTGLILIFSVIILAKFGDMDVVTGNADALQAYNNTMDTTTSFSEWLPIIGILAVAGIIIYLIARSFPQGR